MTAPARASGRVAVVAAASLMFVSAFYYAPRAATEGETSDAQLPSGTVVAADQLSTRITPVRSGGAVAVPAPPADVRAAKAYAVLDSFCASCHQTGRLTIPAPARPLANILALDEIALEPTLVKPGIPDASPLYTIMLRDHATIDLANEPQADAIQSVREWIEDLPRDLGRCRRRPIEQATVARTIAAKLAATPAASAKNLRFVTLTHLRNACVEPAVLELYRQAIAKVVNSLSWAPEPVRLVTIDDAETVLKLDLAEIGWTGTQWDELVAGYPYSSLASANLSEAEQRRTGTLVPVVRGDWFAYAATTAPLYPVLLGLPNRHVDLQRMLNVNIDANIKSAVARRAGLSVSAVTRANRLVERHPTRTGSLWLTYDFAAGEAQPTLFANPLGPSTRAGGKAPFVHDGTKSLFTLPNGFFASSLNDARGGRLDHSPNTIEREQTTWAGPVEIGSSCMACHRFGPADIKDVVREQTETDTIAARELREAILALYPPPAEMESLVGEDREHYARAQRRAGIDPAAHVQGLEPVAALAREYGRDVGLGRIAAELGSTIEEVSDRLGSLPEELQLSIRRLKASSASRAEADRILARLAPDGGRGDRAAVVIAMPPVQRAELELLLWASSDAYAIGDLATFTAWSNQDCYLTLVNIDAAGRATVLFPNELEQNNLLQAGNELRMPGENAPYRFRLKTQGWETLVGVCSTVAKSADGIVHDFERQRFTTLGSWRAYLAQAPAHEAREQASVAEPQQSLTRSRLRGRQGRPDIKPEAKVELKAVDVQARTAIAYEVR